MANRPFIADAPEVDSSYSNQGFGQLGLCLQHASGMGYEDFMQRFVLEPIGIDRMRIRRVFLADEDPIYDSRRYHNYNKGRPHDTNRFTGELTALTYNFRKVPLGSQGSWTATAADMARFMCATDRLKNHPDILNTNSLDVMENDPVPAVGTATHGWFKDANGRLAHNGSVGCGSSYMMRNTNQINVAVICNTANAGFCQGLADWIYNRMLSDPNLIPSIPPFYDLFPSEKKLQLAP
jgi:CubicO group peptidase (beta-lactamase class C family)